MASPMPMASPLASPQAKATEPSRQDVEEWSASLQPTTRLSVSNLKARTQYRLAAIRHAYKCNIEELTKVERVAAPEVRQTVAELPELPTIEPSLKYKLDKQFEKMAPKRGTKECKLYIPGAIVLNELAHLWYKSQTIPPPFVIVHLANPNNPLPGDTYNTQCQPDFVSRRATIEQLEGYLKQLRSSRRKIPNIDDLRPAHGEVVSTVEIKRRTSYGTPQSLNYCSGVLRYRLDQSIAFGLHAAQQSWSLWRLEPCSVSYAGTADSESQEWYSWKEYEQLLRYIAAIHAAELIRDETIDYVPGGGQMWSISMNQVRYRMHPFFASYPPGRMTRVGIAYPTEGGESSDMVYLKISYVDQCREAALYSQAHSKGTIPGLVRLVACESRPSFVKGKHGPKQKEVIVLGSGGEPLSRCESVAELLKVVYDAIETLQAMAEADVLHRDISRGNILCKPKHYHRDEEEPMMLRPYIKAMLDDNVSVDERLTDDVCSLVTDLGHGANMRETTGTVRFERTGTPMYVSGEIAGNTRPRSEPAMRSLAGYFAQLSRQFGERFQDTFNEEFLKLTQEVSKELADELATNHRKALAHSLEALEANAFDDLATEENFDEEVVKLEQPAPRHEPRHDVESAFWVLVCCLVRALPHGANDTPTDTSNSIINEMLYHTLPFSNSNRRDEALTWRKEEWEAALHPKLHCLVPMVVRMCELLGINWRRRSTPHNRFLLHQGFKRLLFMGIRRIEKEDIQLNTERPRTVYASKPEDIRRTLVDSTLRASGQNTSPTRRNQRPKRGLDSTADPGETSSPRKKPRFDHSAQVPLFAQPGRPYDHLFEGSVSPPPPEPVTLPDQSSMEIERMEGPVQLGTVDDDQEVYEVYEERSQEDVENKAMESLAEALKGTFLRHRREAESLVKMHLDDEAWHQVTVEPSDAFN